MTDYPNATWYRAAGFGYPAGTPGRNGQAIIAIVDHIAQGWRAGMLNVLDGAQVGWHYSVFRNGSIEQHIAEEDAAWGAGLDFGQGYAAYLSDLSTEWIARCWRERVSPNLVVINIEHEGMSGVIMPPAQVAASRELHRDISRRRGIRLDSEHVVGHYRLDAVNRPGDPGMAFDWAEILAPLPAPPQPQPMATIRDCLDALWALSEDTHAAVIRAKQLIGGWD